MLKKTKVERMLPLELYYRNVKVTTLALKKTYHMETWMYTME